MDIIATKGSWFKDEAVVIQNPVSCLKSASKPASTAAATASETGSVRSQSYQTRVGSYSVRVRVSDVMMVSSPQYRPSDTSTDPPATDGTVAALSEGALYAIVRVAAEDAVLGALGTACWSASERPDCYRRVRTACRCNTDFVARLRRVHRLWRLPRYVESRRDSARPRVALTPDLMRRRTRPVCRFESGHDTPPPAVRRQRRLRQVAFGGNCGQIFSPLAAGLAGPDIADDEAELFRDLAADKGVGAVGHPLVVPRQPLYAQRRPPAEVAGLDADGGRHSRQTRHRVRERPPRGPHRRGRRRGLDNAVDVLDDLDIPDGVTVLIESDAGRDETRRPVRPSGDGP